MREEVTIIANSEKNSNDKCKSRKKSWSTSKRESKSKRESNVTVIVTIRMTRLTVFVGDSECNDNVQSDNNIEQDSEINSKISSSSES